MDLLINSIALNCARFLVCRRSKQRPAPEGARRWQRQTRRRGLPRCWFRLIIVQRFPMGRARQGEPRTATLSPSSARRLSLYAFRCFARFADSDMPRILRPERLAAAHALSPPDMTDDTGRVVVNVQHCLTPRATIIGPRQRLNEPVAVTLGPLCRR
jgi:hypothetical protein